MRNRFSNLLSAARFTSFCALCFLGTEQGQAGNDFDRYQIILDRKPFGEPPPAAAAAVDTAKVTEDAFKNYRLVGITRADMGLRVGFLDSSVNPPRTLYLALGETQEGLTLLSADYDGECAVVRKEKLEKTFYLYGSPPAGKSAEPSSSAAASVTAAANAGSEAVTQAQSYMERMKKRREAQATRVKEVEPPKLQGAELEKHLQEYNMELIRSGGTNGPPLPIPLTPEQDQQLVEEGVLPPQQ